MSADQPTSLADPRLASPKWRLDNLYYITNKKGDRILFKMNWAQRAFYKHMWFLCVILKARQLGFSTFILIFILDRILFNSDQRAGVIADNRQNASVLFRDKIKYAYDNLPDWLKETRKAVKNDAGELLLSNNSSIRVGTSMRGGTLQYLHISEYGKICAKTPEKAIEVRTGALNAVAEGCFVFMESTAEGAHGDFHDTYSTASDRVLDGGVRTTMDYEPYFFPWWKHPDYRLDADVSIPPKMEEYFATVETELGITLDREQRAWYVKKRQTQGRLMSREYPSTPEEAFNQPIEGAYFIEEMLDAAEEDRIVDFTFNKRIPVNTFWDLGLNASDTTVIWFHQRVGQQNHFIDFYESHGKGLDHYIWMLSKKGYLYDTHYLPHDAKVREIGNGAKPRYEVIEEANIGDVTVVERTMHLPSAIEMIRTKLPNCVIHKTRCADGVKALRSYRREYDEKLEAWKDKPLHDWASNPTDAFRTFADGYEPPKAGRQRKQYVASSVSTL